MTNKYTQLTMDERTFIQLGLMAELKPAQIALELSRSASTITSELNKYGLGSPFEDQLLGPPLCLRGIQRRCGSRSGPRSSCLAQSRAPFAAWECTLGESHRLAQIRVLSRANIRNTQDHPNTPSLQVSHETIYTDCTSPKERI